MSAVCKLIILTNKSPQNLSVTSMESHLQSRHRKSLDKLMKKKASLEASVLMTRSKNLKPCSHKADTSSLESVLHSAAMDWTKILDIYSSNNICIYTTTTKIQWYNKYRAVSNNEMTRFQGADAHTHTGKTISRTSINDFANTFQIA